MSIESQDSEIGHVALELDDGDQRSATIRLSGEFDATNCAKIREIFTIALEVGCKALRLDMSEVSFIGSATLRELLTALRLAAKAQVQVTAVAISPVTRRLLDLADLDLFNDQSQREHPQAASRAVEGPALPPSQGCCGGRHEHRQCHPP